MTSRGYITLTIATAIALVAAIALIIIEQTNASGNRRDGGLMFPDLAERMDEVATVTIEGPQYSIRLNRGPDGRWLATDRANYPIVGEPINLLVNGLSELIAYERKTETPEFFGDLGVAGPAPGRDDVLVTVGAEDGDLLVNAVLGYNARSIGQHTRGGMFVRRVDENQVWLAEGTARPPAFEAQFFEQLFNIPGPEIGRVSILSGDTLLLDAVKVNFETADYELEYIHPSVGPENAIANDSWIRNLTQVVVSVSFENVRDVNDVNVAPDARSVRFVTRQGLSMTITLAEADGVTYAIFTADAAPGSEAEALAAELAARTAGFAFKLPSGRYISLNRDITELFTVPEPEPEPAPEPATPIVPIPVVPGP